MLPAWQHSLSLPALAEEVLAQLVESAATAELAEAGSELAGLQAAAIAAQTMPAVQEVDGWLCAQCAAVHQPPDHNMMRYLVMAKTELP